MSRRGHVVRAWLVGWVGAAGLGVVNGVVRESTYGRRTRQLTAHQISTATLIGSLGSYMWVLHRRWPLPTARDAARVGATWTLLTLGFELGLGRARGLSWREMTEDYDLRRGRVWALVPTFMAVGPAWVRRRQRSR